MYLQGALMWFKWRESPLHTLLTNSVCSVFTKWTRDCMQVEVIQWIQVLCEEYIRLQFHSAKVECSNLIIIINYWCYPCPWSALSVAHTYYTLVKRANFDGKWKGNVWNVGLLLNAPVNGCKYFLLVLLLTCTMCLIWITWIYFTFENGCIFRGFSSAFHSDLFVMEVDGYFVLFCFTELLLLVCHNLSKWERLHIIIKCSQVENDNAVWSPIISNSLHKLIW